MNDCSTSQFDVCMPKQCSRRCAVTVIDELLCQNDVVSGDEADRLLDLRWLLRKRTDAEGTLRLFCDLRLQMENRHYLALFRIRRWLENNIIASVSVSSTQKPELVQLKLDHYCVEAVRRVCLCATLAKGAGLFSPKLRFVFLPEEVQLEPAGGHYESLRVATNSH